MKELNDFQQCTCSINTVAPNDHHSIPSPSTSRQHCQGSIPPTDLSRSMTLHRNASMSNASLKVSDRNPKLTIVTHPVCEKSAHEKLLVSFQTMSTLFSLRMHRDVQVPAIIRTFVTKIGSGFIIACRFGSLGSEW
jgi:hypothetical protein